MQLVLCLRVVLEMKSINLRKLPLLSGYLNTSALEPGREQQETPVSPDQSNSRKGTESSSGRLVSLDAFRGFTIFGMLLVNNAAMDTATPRHFTHAAWNSGIHFADLVFPWFLLIVGVAVPYAYASHLKRGKTVSKYMQKAASRAIILFLLGCFIDSSIAKRPIIGLGVLQLIGLAYFFAVIIYQLPSRWRDAVALGLLLTHWAAIRFIPIPNLGAGAFLETGNLIYFLNQAFLQQYHLKGIISVIPTSALVLIGAAIGDLLRDQRRTPTIKAVYLINAGVILAVVGWLWNLDLPFNKPLWTSSYILYSAGMGSILLGVLYLLIDVEGWLRWPFPLVVFGMNAILAYVLPIIVKVYVLQGWHWFYSDGTSLSLQQAALHSLINIAGRVYGGWFYTCGYIVFWWLVLLIFYKKKVFLRI